MIGCLIIHGFTGGPYEVEPLTNYLKEKTNWQIEVPVLSGHGTELDLEHVNYEEWLSDAVEALVTLKETCETIYVIGFSMGGMIAAYLAANYQIDRLVLLSTARRYLSFRHLSTYIRDGIEASVKGELKESPLYQHYKYKFDVVPFTANIEFMKLVNKTKAYLKHVTTPVFIAQGQKDALVPAKTAYYLHDEISSEDKEVVFFERSNHLICLGNDQDVLNVMIYRFLNDKGRDKTKRV